MIWDVVAWNRAATIVFTDYAELQPEQRNIIRLMFCSPIVRANMVDWENIARFVVSVLRADMVRLGAAKAVEPFIQDLCERSSEFKKIWRDRGVSGHGEGIKQIINPASGQKLELEYSAFSVDSRPDLTMLVYSPVSDDGMKMLERLLTQRTPT